MEAAGRPDFVRPVPVCTNYRIAFDGTTPSRAYAVRGQLISLCPLCFAVAYTGTLLGDPDLVLLSEDRQLLLAEVESVVRYVQHLSNLSTQARAAQRELTEQQRLQALWDSVEASGEEDP
jgi:hypothetical protein